ncbi:LysR family transcriptional regulator [Mycolicibacterium aromaticivorans JS19b1 = JCM 16368]|uniref:Probable hydrogen peroxide-inducible genes activator n=1 Tax=Mycolicibacterium aromaticivorans JS19b1 = JCM 16368 TaxID=1440774 RepID=A0A064CBL6_9MYCO|nr:LysR family transcriptional regulator [Mycolicibacterium aromaticivorans]KDE98019.1 LysR family transcriptional regulator [Mycolicibacterium aromaticivorans JS19b1 = JCM 16368]
MDPSLTGLRVLCAVAERGTFTAAGQSLGYTQSAVSRQVAGLERETGVMVFERNRDGVRLTSAGLILLRHARVVLDAIAAAEAELDGTLPDVHEVRVGAFLSAGAVLLPRAVQALRDRRPDIRLTTREGTTPSLVRALRAGALDLAVIALRPPYAAPDTELPAVVTERLGESTLELAVPAYGRFAGRDAVSVAELGDVDWVASPSSRDESLMGVWPGLAGRPRIAHSARDWLTKLQLVAAGCGVTTVSPSLAEVLPEGVRLVRVEGASPERRRILVARLPGRPSPSVAVVIEALRRAYPD